MSIERTLSIMKPDAVAGNDIGTIYQRFEQSGLKVIAAKMCHLSAEEAEGFYAEHKERSFFAALITFMTSGPVMLSVLEGEHAVCVHRDLMGATNPQEAAPGTIRADLAKTIDENAVHGSDAVSSAKRKFRIFSMKKNCAHVHDNERLYLEYQGFFIVLCEMIKSSEREEDNAEVMNVTGIADPTHKIKTNLLDLNREKLEHFFDSLGEKSFRAQQIMKWIYHRGVADFSLMTDISGGLRDKLSQIAVIQAPEVVNSVSAADGVKKWMIRTHSGSLIETVYIPEKGRGTLCVSSQVGCILDCSFCSTGKQGFNSNLHAYEIIGQVFCAMAFLSAQQRNTDLITNVVMMGMGEPLMNFEPVMTAMDLMMDDCGYGLSKRRVTLSTSGVIPAIYRMINRTDVSLAVSIHAANDALRNTLVPINKKYPLHELLMAMNEYMKSLPDKSRVVTIEYTLLQGINDQEHHAKELASLLCNTPCKINLIPFNPFPNSGYECPSNNAIRRFQQALQKKRFNVTVRKTRGEQIDAACGQLVGNITDKTKRQQRYLSKKECVHMIHAS